MKRQAITTFFAILALLSLCACYQQQADDKALMNETNPNDQAIPILMLELIDGATVQAKFGHWDIFDGVLPDTFTAGYRMEVTGFWHPIVWDGKKKIVMEEHPTAIDDDRLHISTELIRNDSGIMYCSGDVYIAKKDGDGIGETVYWRDENDPEREFDILYTETPAQISRHDLMKDGYIVFAEADEHTIILVYQCIMEETFELAALRIDLETKEANWVKCGLDEYYFPMVAVLSSPTDKAYIDNKIYMSAETEMLIWDLEDGSVAAMTESIDRAKELIPNASQTNKMRLTPPILPVGVWNDILIVYIPFYTPDDADHATYFAIYRDEIIGAIDCNSMGIDLYDGDLQRINSLPGTGEFTPLVFPRQ